jgi:hypothetical protein
MQNPPTPDEMLASLRRSGYLLEGRIVECLDSLGFFVESNCAYLDRKTGVSQEMDVVAETFRFNQEPGNTCIKTTFIMEAINNAYPALLMTPYKWTPNIDEEEFSPYCVTPPATDDDHPFMSDLPFLEIWRYSHPSIYSQYCGFSRKKQNDELMASHPEDLYASLKKAVEYALTRRDESNEWMAKANDKYWRIFQWRPVVVLGGELYLFENSKVLPTAHACLRFNLHWNGEARGILVDFITEDALPALVKTVEKEDEAIESKLRELRKEKE